jgi:hypothetical protein
VSALSVVLVEEEADVVRRERMQAVGPAGDRGWRDQADAAYTGGWSLDVGVHLVRNPNPNPLCAESVGAAGVCRDQSPHLDPYGAD